MDFLVHVVTSDTTATPQNVAIQIHQALRNHGVISDVGVRYLDYRKFVQSTVDDIQKVLA